MIHEGPLVPCRAVRSSVRAVQLKRCALRPCMALTGFMSRRSMEELAVLSLW